MNVANSYTIAVHSCEHKDFASCLDLVSTIQSNCYMGIMMGVSNSPSSNSTVDYMLVSACICLLDAIDQA